MNFGCINCLLLFSFSREIFVIEGINKGISFSFIGWWSRRSLEKILFSESFRTFLSQILFFSVAIPNEQSTCPFSWIPKLRLYSSFSFRAMSKGFKYLDSRIPTTFWTFCSGGVIMAAQSGLYELFLGLSPAKFKSFQLCFAWYGWLMHHFISVSLRIF